MAGRCELRARAVTAPALRGLSRFADARGIPAGREFWLDYDVIEAFCVAGLAGQACSTRGTYRSALYRLARRITGSRGSGRRRSRAPGRRRRTGRPNAPSWRPSPLPSAIRRNGPRRWPWWCSASAPGCGPASWWRCAAATSPASPGWPCGSGAGRAGGAGYPGLCRAAAGLAAGAGDGHLFRPGPADRGYKNFVTNFARALTAGPAAPRLSLGRCRSSFICGHLAAGTPVAELLAVTGICQAERGPLRTPRRRRPAQGRAAGLGQAPGGTLMNGGGLEIPRPATPRRAGRRVCRRAHRPQRAGPGHRGGAGPPHRAAPPAAGTRRAGRAVVPGAG